jgi:hypothetical protein
MGKAGSGARQHATITYKVIKKNSSVKEPDHSVAESDGLRRSDL